MLEVLEFLLLEEGELVLEVPSSLVLVSLNVGTVRGSLGVLEGLSHPWDEINEVSLAGEGLGLHLTRTEYNTVEELTVAGGNYAHSNGGNNDSSLVHLWLVLDRVLQLLGAEEHLLHHTSDRKSVV